MSPRPTLREMVDAFKALARLGQIVERSASFFGSNEPDHPRRTWWPAPPAVWEKLGFAPVWEELPSGAIEGAWRLMPDEHAVLLTPEDAPTYTQARYNLRAQRRAAWHRWNERVQRRTRANEARVGAR